MTGVRARVRAELTAEITRLARVQMEREGPANVNLRAIARELGMVSSAVYRYFASRDDLLTALIVDAYNDLGAAAEQADAGVADRTDVEGRFLAVARSAYTWARANPSQYLLLFGTPVPGYAAPDDTIAPATRFNIVLLQVLDEAARQGALPAVVPEVPPSIRADLGGIRSLTGTDVDDALMLAGLQSWTALFGAISFILNGQFRNVVGDVDAMFESFAHSISRQVFRQDPGTAASPADVEQP